MTEDEFRAEIDKRDRQLQTIGRALNEMTERFQAVERRIVALEQQAADSNVLANR